MEENAANAWQRFTFTKHAKNLDEEVDTLFSRNADADGGRLVLILPSGSVPDDSAGLIAMPAPLSCASSVASAISRTPIMNFRAVAAL